MPARYQGIQVPLGRRPDGYLHAVQEGVRLYDLRRRQLRAQWLYSESLQLAAKRAGSFIYDQVLIEQVSLVTTATAVSITQAGFMTTW